MVSPRTVRAHVDGHSGLHSERSGRACDDMLRFKRGGRGTRLGRETSDVHALHQRALERSVSPRQLAEGAADAMAHARSALLDLSDCTTAENALFLVGCEYVSARTLEAVVRVQFLQKRLIDEVAVPALPREPVEEAGAMHQRTSRALESLLSRVPHREVEGRPMTDIDSPPLGLTSVPCNALKDVGNQLFDRSNADAELVWSKSPDVFAAALHLGLRADASKLSPKLSLGEPNDVLEVSNLDAPPLLVTHGGVVTGRSDVSTSERTSAKLLERQVEVGTGVYSDLASRTGVKQGDEPWRITDGSTAGAQTTTVVQAPQGRQHLASCSESGSLEKQVLVGSITVLPELESRTRDRAVLGSQNQGDEPWPVGLSGTATQIHTANRPTMTVAPRQHLLAHSCHNHCMVFRCCTLSSGLTCQ